MDVHKKIWEALDSGDLNQVRRVFEKHPKELHNTTPVLGCHIHRACADGNLSMVQTMVNLGADIDLKDERDGIAPIVNACSSARFEVVEFLLSQGCELDVSTSLRNPMFSCICSILLGNKFYCERAGYSQDEARVRLLEIANLLIENGIDLTSCYVQQSMVDMTAAAFAEMYGRQDIAQAIINKLYGHDEKLAASASSEAIEVAMGNAYSRKKFRRWRYPPNRGKNKDWRPPPGEYWQKPEFE